MTPKQIKLNRESVAAVKLTDKQKSVIKKMREGKNIYISRYSDNMGLTGTDISLTDTFIERFINDGLAVYSHDSDIHNFYTLTALGKNLKID